jgi:serine/threonine protein kinase
MINEICCEKTRNYLTSFGSQPPKPWEEILASKDHETNPAAIDLIAKLARMDPTKRLDVHEAINHPFFRPFIKHIPTEPACPFRVRDFWGGILFKHYLLVSGKNGHGSR